ncbi:MAG: hypothetical protein ACM3KR_01050 [Deltaproteobacteria bacterium]
MKAKTFDVEKLKDYFRECRAYQREEAIKQKQQADAFCNGYSKAIGDVIDMLNSSNYEAKEQEEAE